MTSCMGGSTGNLARHFKSKHPNKSLHWTLSLAELSDSTSSHNGWGWGVPTGSCSKRNCCWSYAWEYHNYFHFKIHTGK